MGDPRVTFVKADAFRFAPPAPVDWLVSDVIAYPDRVLELLRRWCGEQLAVRMVVTMKFQGSVAWEALDEAASEAAAHGYACRSKHFFTNKNEVTLMLTKEGAAVQGAQPQSDKLK